MCLINWNVDGNEKGPDGQVQFGGQLGQFGQSNTLNREGGGLDNVRVIGYVKCKRRNTNSITNIACIMNLWVNCENLNSSASRVSWSPFRVLCVLSGLLLRAGWQAMYLMPRKWSSPTTTTVTTSTTAGCYSFQMQINEQQLAREEDKKPICNKSIRRASVSLSLSVSSLSFSPFSSHDICKCVVNKHFSHTVRFIAGIAD